MTLPEQPTAGEIMRALGRLENTITQLASEVDKLADKLGDKLDDHADQLARHDERIAVLERGAQRGWERFGLWVMVILAPLLSALLSHLWR